MVVLLEWLLIICLSLMLAQSKTTNTSLVASANLPSFCRRYGQDYIYSKDESTKFEWLKCENGFNLEMWTRFEAYLRAYLKKNQHRAYLSVAISIRAPTDAWSIVGDSFHVFNIHKNLTNDRKDYYFYRLTNLKGFDIDSSFPGDFSKDFLIFYMDFNLYKKNRVVKNCDDYFGHNSSNFYRRFIFHGEIKSLIIYRPQTIYPVCSSFFRNSRIQEFCFNTIANSFYMKNSVTFTSSNPRDENNLNSSIINLSIYQVYMIDLDSRLLDARIFSSMNVLHITGHLSSIESNVFAPFTSLRKLHFESTSILDLIRRQGIEWIKHIKADVRVDVRNREDFVLQMKYLTQIIFSSDRFERFEFYDEKHDDADFCLFVDFPFRQMIFIHPDPYRSYSQYQSILFSGFSFTCTELWLYQFHIQLTSWFRSKTTDKFDTALNASNLTTCEFEKRIKICNRSNFQLNTQNNKRRIFTSFDLMVAVEFAFVIILPVLLASFVTITNLIVIRVIYDEESKTKMRKKQYIYMSLHCASNVLICFIQITSLLNECQYPYTGLFCSSIRHSVGIQYLRIIFGEYFNSLLRLVSNFTYFGFSICRLAKIGKNHSQLTVFVNEGASIKAYMGVVVFLSAGLSVCKCLQFEINSDTPELAYPLPLFQNPYKKDWIKRPKFVAIFVINIVYNLLNYFIFVMVHLVVDLVLIRKLWSVMREKEERMREMRKSENEMEKMCKENEESKRRAVIMVICNSTFNFCLKIPLLIPSLNDFRLLIHNTSVFREELKQTFNFLRLFSSPLNFKFYCESEKSCMIFQSFGNCLFLVSLAAILFFLKHFDMNFKCAFQNVFHHYRRKNNSEKEIK